MREIQSGCVARPQSDVTPATIRSVRLNEINTQRQRGWFSKKNKKNKPSFVYEPYFYTKAAAMHNHSKRTVLVSS